MHPILLVEDQPDTVFLFQHTVKKLGIANLVQVATDGQEALDYLKGTGKFGDRSIYPMPGLVLLDLKLPREPGLEVLRQIRADPHLRRLIVVVLTSSASDYDIGSAYDQGANAYLVKPMELHDLAKMVEAIRDFWLTQNRPSLPHAQRHEQGLGPR